MDAPHFRSFYELTLGRQEILDSSPAMSDSSVDEADHVHHIQTTWASLQDKLPEVGRRVYEKVVHKNIEVATLFQDTAFESQHFAFMTMMGQSIEWLNNMGQWHRKMTPLAQRHVNYGVKPNHYKHFRSAFLKAIREFLSDDWNEEIEDAWIWYWGKIMDTLGHATQSNLQNSTIGVSQFAHYARAVHEVWQIVANDPAAFGSSFYENLIGSHPEMAALFASANLGRQSIRFFTMFNHAVRQMDDAAGFEHAIIALTYKHKLYGVEMHHVDSFGLALKESLRVAVGDEWTREREEAWDWFWARIHACFEYGLAHSHSVEEAASEMNAERQNADDDAASDSTPVDADVSSARIFQPILTLRELQQRR